MSLKSIGSKIKEAGKDITSATGIQKLIVQLGLGFALGVIIDLALEAFIHWVVEPRWRVPRILGIKIFPQAMMDDPNDPTKTVPYLAYDDVALLISTVFLLFTRKVWFALGYFVGWYSSSYMALYQALRLPLPQEGS